jgi:hypothetical protein
MSTIELAQQIAALPTPSRVQVERLVARLARAIPPKSGPDDLAERAQAIRERIFAKHGSLGNSTDDIRRLRENGR